MAQVQYDNIWSGKRKEKEHRPGIHLVMHPNLEHVYGS